MNTKPVYLTAEGLAKLKAELHELITVDRPRVAARIHEAKLDGDLQRERRVRGRQAGAVVPGGPHRHARAPAAQRRRSSRRRTATSVGIGSKVVIKGGDGEETFTIVGSAEAAPREGRISNESPVGAALMGRKKGDKVTVQAPGRADRVHARRHRLGATGVLG